MSEQAHSDPAKGWLIFFFVCFSASVLAIGVWAAFCYDVNQAEPTQVSGGHH